MQIRSRDPDINSKWRTTGCEKLTFFNLTNCSDFAVGVKKYSNISNRSKKYLSIICKKKKFQKFYVFTKLWHF